MNKYLKNKEVRLRFREDIELQETFLDNLAKKKEQEFGISENGNSSFAKDFLWFFIFYFYSNFCSFYKNLSAPDNRGEGIPSQGSRE